MAHRQLERILGSLLRLEDGPEADALSDAALLRDFVHSHDEDTFQVLLERHGPMILGVCRRLLHDEHEAEDAFQATFLVLVRKAASLRRPESLGSWLYGVAYRIARRSRMRLNRTTTGWREVPAAGGPDEELAWRELRPVLDEELQRLPEKYRKPILLCFVEGKTQEGAARDLGWTRGALRGRLERGRDLLQRRLARRGIALPPVLLAGVLTGRAAAVVPGNLASTTAGAASALAERHSAAGLVSTPVLRAVERTLLIMRVKKVSAVLVVVVVAVLAAGGAAHLGRRLLAEKPGEPPAQAAAEPPPADPEPPRKEEPLPADPQRDPLPEGAVTRLGTLRLYHEGGFHAAYSADGKVLASAGNGVIRLWDAGTGRELRELPGARGFALSADGNRLASSGDMDPERLLVRIWDTTTGKELFRLPGHKEEIFTLAFSPDGTLLATGSFDRTLRLWDPVNGKEVRVLIEGQGLIHKVAFAPDSKTLISAEDKMSRVWDVGTGKELHRFEGRQFLALSADGQVMAVSDDSGRTLQLLKLPGGDEVVTVRNLPGVVQSVSIAPDGKLLATASHMDPAVRLWDATTGKPVRTIALPDYLFSVAFSPDGKTLATAVPWSAPDASRVRLWDPATGAERTFPGHEGAIAGVRFSADGKAVMSAAVDRTFRLWQVADGKEVRAAALPRVPFALSPDGSLVAASRERHQQRGGLLDPTLDLWETATGKVRHHLGGHENGVWQAAFTPDSATVAVATGNGGLVLWDTASGKQLNRWTASATMALVFSPDGKTLATGGMDCAVRLWEAGSGKLLHTLGTPLDLSGPRDGVRVTGTSAIAFSPDGKSVVAAVVPQNTISLWDADSGKELRQFKGHPDGWHQGWVHALAFTPDGKALISASEDRTVRLWDVATGKGRRTLTGHLGGVRALAVSADGSRLASGSQDCTVLLWDLKALDKPER
jgi:RNA polymerase sigma factor (sigma-70 family)